jgi:hypothetical protein
MDSYQGNGSDPITLHKYLYGNLNPISVRDPSGRFGLTEITIAAAVQGDLLEAGVFQLFEAGVHGVSGNRPTHYYETNNIKICSASSSCTPANVYKLMLRMPATAHGDPDLGREVQDNEAMYAGWSYFPGGYVRVTRIDSQYKHINKTTIVHSLHEGTITRQAVYGMGGVTITTIGEGNNYTHLLALLNTVVGKAAFENLDTIIRTKYEEGVGQ